MSELCPTPLGKSIEDRIIDAEARVLSPGSKLVSGSEELTPVVQENTPTDRLYGLKYLMSFQHVGAVAARLRMCESPFSYTEGNPLEAYTGASGTIWIALLAP